MLKNRSFKKCTPILKTIEFEFQYFDMLPKSFLYKCVVTFETPAHCKKARRVSISGALAAKEN